MHVFFIVTIGKVMTLGFRFNLSWWLSIVETWETFKLFWVLDLRIWPSTYLCLSYLPFCILDDFLSYTNQDLVEPKVHHIVVSSILLAFFCVSTVNYNNNYSNTIMIHNQATYAYCGSPTRHALLLQYLCSNLYTMQENNVIQLSTKNAK